MASVSPAMGRSLGTSSTAVEAASLASQMSQFSNRLVLMVGDSSLRNQFMQLARIGLSFDRDTPVAHSVVHGKHSGHFLAPFPIEPADKPDSSNGFWGGFPWLIASTPTNLTLVYAKVWGCSSLVAVLRRTEAILRKQRHLHPALAAWPPSAVLWNFGLHLLHVYPARPVPTVSLRCALDYDQLVSASLRELRVALPPSTHLIWRTTNAVCDSSFVGSWAAAVHAYHCSRGAAGDRKCAAPRIMRTRKLCQRRYNVSEHECESTFMDRRNTAAQRLRSLGVLRRVHPHVDTLDAFGITDGRCSATADGRHYPQLLAKINQRLLGMM
jgi:hypothetical protein